MGDGQFMFVLVYANRITSDEETSEREIDADYQEGLFEKDVSVFDDKAVICKTTIKSPIGNILALTILIHFIIIRFLL